MNSFEEIALRVAKDAFAEIYGPSTTDPDPAMVKWISENARRLVAALGAQEPVGWQCRCGNEDWSCCAKDVFDNHIGYHSSWGWRELFAAPVLPSVPEVTDVMVTAYLKANDTYWDETDALAPPPDKWRTGNPRDATRVSLEAAFRAATPSPQEDKP